MKYRATIRPEAEFVVFTIRRGKIRVISARDMNKKERKIYHEKIKKHPEI